MEYTEKIHAERLIKILNKKGTCNKCPATKRFRTIGARPSLEACFVCMKFIGMKFKKEERMKMFSPNHCPCIKYGEKLAIKKSWLALEKNGYLT